MIRVLLVDDQQLFLESLKIVLETSSREIQVVATASTGYEALEYVRTQELDVILLDVRMPELDGVATVREIRKISQDVRVVMLTTFDDDQYVLEAIRNGATGYLLKDISAEEIVASVIAVFQGTASISPHVLEKLARGLPTEWRRGVSDGAESSREEKLRERIHIQLTRQEKRILKLLGDGQDNYDIAESLNLAPQTVKNYVSSIYYKLGSHKRGEIARAARRYFHADPFQT